ncbi:MAG: hypothetical protein E5V62_28960 [Mesorhizobium sp.]|nr:hypothetical protein EN751_31245 [Mesorhizobium sp. M4A.F.Ca.ET.029.04.2.1]TIW31480.1 MAG: hypothetical protein E5V62_28960 [Mesorhizobium sp.]
MEPSNRSGYFPRNSRGKTATRFFLELLFCSYAIPDGKPLRTFPGIAILFLRNSGRKTASHFSWNCF